MLSTMTATAIFKEHDPTHKPIYITVDPCTKKEAATSVPVLVLWPPYQEHQLLLLFFFENGAIIFRVDIDYNRNCLPTSLWYTIAGFSPQQIITEFVGGRSSPNETTIVLNKSLNVDGGKKIRKLQQSTSINKMAIDYEKLTTTTINHNNLKTQQATIVITTK